MIYTCDVAIYETTSLMSNQYKKVLKPILVNALKTDNIDVDDLKHFDLDRKLYSILISKGAFFNGSKSPFQYLIISKGHQKDIETMQENTNDIVLSFPIWNLTEDDLEENKEHLELINDMKSFYIDQNRQSIRTINQNPKFISAVSEDIEPILKLIKDGFEPNDDICALYEKEQQKVLSNIIFTLTHIKVMNETLSSTLGFKKYLKYDYPLLGFESNGKYCWVKSTDGHCNVFVEENGVYSHWYIDRYDFEEYDDNNNPIHGFALCTSNIQNNKDAFVEWITTQHEEPELVFSKDAFIKEIPILQSLESVYTTFGLVLSSLLHFCPNYQPSELFIPTAKEMLAYDLGFESHVSLIGWLFLGSSSYSWKCGGLVSEYQVCPYQKLDAPLPYKRDSGIEAAGDLSYSDVLIKNIPNNVHESFKPYIKEAYDLLLSGEYPHVSTEGFDMTKLERRLKTLKII